MFNFELEMSKEDLLYIREGRMKDEIDGIICGDQKDAFVSFLNDPKTSHYTDESNVLEWICLFNSVKCATALLQGETVFEADLNSPLHCDLKWGCYPLHIVARYLNPDLIDLFLRHGARTDIPLHDEFWGKDFEGLLPLNMALKSLSNLEHLKTWTPGHSVFELITLLCLPELKKGLDTVRLLAWSSKEVEETAYHYAKEGKPIELAVLLMVAREKVLGPITFQSKDGPGLDVSMTFSQRINHEIIPLIDEEFKLMGRIKCSKFSQMHKDKMGMMRSIMLLLEVFERVGDVIEGYLQLRQPDVPREQVVKDVALRLVEAGFDLKSEDSDISDINCTRDPTQHAMEESEESYPHPGLQLPFPLQENMCFNPRKGALGNGFPWSFPFSNGMLGLPSVRRSTHTNRVSKCNFGSLYSKDLDAQVKKRTKAIEQYAPKFPTGEKWAYFALVIKRGMRRA